MNLSTSSSDAAGSKLRREWRVVAVLLCCLVLLELLFRVFETRLSLDLKHIRSLPQTAKALQKHDGDTVLFVGNSLTRCAISKDVMHSGFTTHGRRNPGIYFFNADATNVTHWDYGFNRYFVFTGCHPKEVFIGTGPWHLADRKGDADRLGAFYVAGRDMNRALTGQDLTGSGDWSEFFLARYSAVYANRERLKPHVFGAIIPHYFDMEQWVNDQRTVVKDGTRGGSSPGNVETYYHLDTLLKQLKDLGIVAHIFTIPQPEPYELPSEAVAVIKSRGAILHHLAGDRVWPLNSFSDGYHLNQAAAVEYSKLLVDSLKRYKS